MAEIKCLRDTHYVSAVNLKKHIFSLLSPFSSHFFFVLSIFSSFSSLMSVISSYDSEDEWWASTLYKSESLNSLSMSFNTILTYAHTSGEQLLTL